ncbi:MAG: sodium:proton antiporter [Phycisphaerales bacterium]|nr:sodium:proton antiporter [Phycisphaerales bacterium]
MHDGSTQSLALAIGVGSLVAAVCSRLKIPAVLPLLVTGVVLGGSGLDLIDGDSLGAAFKAFIAASIGLLVFEGGLHLSRKELGKAPRAVVGLLTVGALATWGGVAIAARYLIGLDWPVALVLGAVLIVTGPTVIQPILRRLPLKPGLHSALAAEGILIDPIGVIISISMLEVAIILLEGGGALNAPELLMKLVRPFGAGIGVGVAVGLLAMLMMKIARTAGRIDPSRVNLIGIGACMVAVGAGEAIAPEAGLVAATIAAILLANTNVPGARELHQFKETLATMLVGTLFVLLASRFDINRLLNVTAMDWLFVGVVMFVVRPINIIVSTVGSRLSWREKVFASLFAPRGIVAASVASIAAVQLTAAAGDNADIARQAATLDLLTFLVIAISVAWAGGLGRPLAWLLNVGAGAPDGVLVVGAHPLNIALAKIIQEHKGKVLIVDSNPLRIASARAGGLKGEVGDATDPHWIESHVHQGQFGWLIACTGNADVDRVVARWGRERLGKARVMEGLAPIGSLPHDQHDLATILEAMEDGHVNLVTLDKPQPDAITLAMIRGEKIALWDAPAKPSPDTRFITLVRQKAHV